MKTNKNENKQCDQPSINIDLYSPIYYMVEFSKCFHHDLGSYQIILTKSSSLHILQVTNVKRSLYLQGKVSDCSF